MSYKLINDCVSGTGRVTLLKFILHIKYNRHRHSYKHVTLGNINGLTLSEYVSVLSTMCVTESNTRILNSRTSVLQVLRSFEMPSRHLHVLL